MNATIITIGTEILIGQVIDTNSAYLGEELNQVGVKVKNRISISDIREDMLQALEWASSTSDIIIMTGGLGPTKDDITKKIIAEFLSVEMYFDQEQFDRITAFFNRIQRPMTVAHREQCFFPEGTEFLENKMGTAPGMVYYYNNKIIISMPGVPYEMKYITENHLIPLLQKKQSEHLLHKTICTAGVGETILADKISDIENNLPEHMDLAYLPSLGKVRVRVSTRNKNKAQAEQELATIVHAIELRFGDIIYGYDNIPLAKAVGDLMLERKLSLSTAESCTGGNIAKMITEIPGSSAYFEGSTVTYSNRLKNQLLHVKPETLEAFGAVSQETVKEMIEGALDMLGTDLAIAVSGIAGPGGGTETKPVGLIFIGVGNKDRIEIRQLNLTKNRIKNIEFTSYAALNLLRLFIIRHLS